MCAVIKRGILGGFQNKIANVVGGSWKGISYMRSLPISVANPRTAAQTSNRDNFKAAVNFAVLILSTVIKPLWDRFAQYQSGYNAFISTNFEFFGSGALAFPESLIISKGTLQTVFIATVAVDASAKTIAMTWDGTPGGDANASDLLYVVLYNESQQLVEGFDTGIQRFVGTATIGVNIALTAGDSYYLYAAFKKADGTKVSDTDRHNGSVVA